jgi:hypothetical protein
MAKQQQDEQSQFALVMVDEDEMNLPTLPALRLPVALNRVQERMEAEIANRVYAIDGHRALGQQAHEGVGRVARVAAGQFHRSVGQHSRLVAESKGLPFAQCEQEFLRLNLQQQMQNAFSISDGVAKNLRDQVIDPLHVPNHKPKRWWQM